MRLVTALILMATGLFAQAVTFEAPTATRVTINVAEDGGQIVIDGKGPQSFPQHNLEARWIEHNRGGSGWILTNTGRGLHDRGGTDVLSFDSMVVEGPHVPAIGAWGPYHIPPDPAHWRNSLKIPESNHAHVLVGGERLPVLRDGIREPTPEECFAAIELLRSVWNIDALRNPRLRHILSKFGWDNDDGDNETGDRDVAWLTQNWAQRTGSGLHLVGHYKAWQPRWGDGYLNNEFESVLWHFVNYLVDVEDGKRSSKNWHYAVGLLMHHISFGRIWSGEWRGWMAYTKGKASVGEFQTPRIEKQKSLVLAVAAVLTGWHPMIEEALREWWAVLASDSSSMKPRIIWNGNWGSRRLAVALKELRLAYLCDPPRRSIYLTKARALIDHAVDNVMKGDASIPLTHGTHPSPWQDAQVVVAMLEWGYRVDFAYELARTVWRLGTYEHAGRRLCGYRYDAGGVVDYRHTWPTMAFLLPMLRKTRAPQSQRTHRDFYAHIASRLVGGVWVIDPLTKVGIDWAPGGLSTIRTFAYELAGAIL